VYIALLLVLLAAAAVCLVLGVVRRRPGLAALGAALVAFTVVFFSLLSFWGELLWFRSLGYEQRFWRVLAAKYGLALAAAAVGWGVLHLATARLPADRPVPRWASRVLGAVIGFGWGVSSWPLALKFAAGVTTGTADPILNQDVGFYLFSLPFWDAVYDLAFWLALLALVATVAAAYLRLKPSGLEMQPPPDDPQRLARLFPPLFASGGVFFLVLAAGVWLERYHLLYSTWGAVHGPGWTDVHVRLPGYWILALALAAAGVGLWLPAVRRRAQGALAGWLGGQVPPRLAPLAAAAAAGLAVWLLALTLAPQLLQWLKVEPNEITLERPYITHNIAFTRQGFNLHQVEEREFPASGDFSRRMVENNQELFANVRLWDRTALDAVYKQFQEIRLYYEFVGIDIDRYTYGGNYRQVMVSAREMETGNLPPQSQTFVNRRFKYTHGYGITMNPVHEFTPQGLPDLLIKDIPPVSEHPELEVARPEVYYGELTDQHVIVNSSEQEFDFPRGEKNAYNRYQGRGGVQLSGLWRKFLYGWMFDGTRLLLSGYPTPESRILFRRQVTRRLQEVAPFLQFDDDPYVVLSQGRLYWIVDAYTTSRYYPYSKPFLPGELVRQQPEEGEPLLAQGVLGNLAGANYVRNSVKAVVDAYHGEVKLYVFDQEDPIIRTWRRILPGLFQDRGQMPEDLQRHIRYPADLLLAQGLVYAKYHMTDPSVFYNQEDLWVRATEKYHNEVVPVQPYYVMWRPPQSGDLEFVLILPFTPKNRQVLIGWIAGMCDPPNYGRFLAYKFPKEKRVLGPQQVETKIDQDRHLSGQLTLWDQRGSNVIRGNVLAIPIDDSLLYVEPIYLQAETAAYPELRLVVLMHNDVLSYAESFDKALKGLLEGGVRVAPGPEAETGRGLELDQLVRRAREAFQGYLEAQGGGRFQEAAEALQRLQQSLQRLQERTGQPRPAGAEGGG
jgi:uncharacterized membrane protein (UPF0182 family)